MSDTIDICQELHQNFIDFSYEANSERAFPDARDGLKPGQRACLWEMYSKGYLSNKPHVKSAKISGGTIASWWPHGSTAIYETFGRMSQPWINNLCEVDWHGNNGNIVIGQALAADRYTEARLAKVVEEGMFQGIKKNNVNMIPNFSNDNEWPEVLPAVLPRLLVNGAQGIGVTIANHWAPMNLKEVGEVIIEYIKNGSLRDNLKLFDFPTGGIIINEKDLPSIHKTGKGKIVLRGKAEIVKNTIKITELPYQVYVEPLIEKIKELVTNEEITNIKEIYNKTDKNKLLIEIECSANPEAVLNALFAKTPLQSTYNPNQWALVGKTPQLLTLEDYIKIYIAHNLECITREYQFDLNKKQTRKEIVEGLIKALEDIDNIITLIKQSNSAADAVVNLMNQYKFTELQAKAIVDMKLGRLAHLEKVELNDELTALVSEITDLQTVLGSEDKKKEVLISRLNSIIQKYGANRKTQLAQIEIVKEDTPAAAAIEPKKCVVIMTENGTIKRVPADTYRPQNKNGRGIKTQADVTSCIIRTNTVDSLMIFTNFGNMYRLLVDNIPEGTNSSKGMNISNIIQMQVGEVAQIIYSIYRDTDAKFIMFITKAGLAKKTSLDEYINTKKKTGMAAITLNEGDSIAAAFLSKDENVIVASKNGQLIRFNAQDIAPTGRIAKGCKAINLAAGDEVKTAIPQHDSNDNIALILSNGNGKLIDINEIPVQKKGGKGLMGVKITEPSVEVAGIALVEDKDTLLISGNNSSICISAKDLPMLQRPATGVQLLKGNKVMSISKI